MNKNISLIAFGTFGIPNGFRQTLFLGHKESFSAVKTFDLNTNALKLFPNTRVYSMRKQLVDGNTTIAYSVYSYAKEKNSDRGGTFVGSSILFYNKIATETLTLNCLNEFHNELITNKSNVENNIIQISHSDNFTLIKKSKDFDKLSFNLKDFGEINFTSNNKDLIIYNLIKPEMFEKSLELLNTYDTIFFTQNEDIAKFVHDKKLIKLIQNGQFFDDEVQLFRDQREQEKKREIDQAIERVERDLNLLGGHQKQFFELNVASIDLQKKQLQENEIHINRLQKQHVDDNGQINTLANQLSQLNTHHVQYRKRLESALQELKSAPVQPDILFKHLEKYQKDLEHAKNNFKIPTVTRLLDLQPRSQTPSSRYSSKYEDRSVSNGESKKYSSRIGLYKSIIILLFFLWVSTIIFFLFFNREIFNVFIPLRN